MVNQEPKVVLENRVYPKTYYHHKLSHVQKDETPTKVKVQKLHSAKWTLTEDQ